jgi:hypothetical protein
MTLKMNMLVKLLIVDGFDVCLYYLLCEFANIASGGKMRGPSSKARSKCELKLAG